MSQFFLLYHTLKLCTNGTNGTTVFVYNVPVVNGEVEQVLPHQEALLQDLVVVVVRVLRHLPCSHSPRWIGLRQLRKLLILVNCRTSGTLRNTRWSGGQTGSPSHRGLHWGQAATLGCGVAGAGDFGRGPWWLAARVKDLGGIFHICNFET